MTTSIRVLFIDDSEQDVWILLNELRHADYVPVYERVYTPRTLETALSEHPWDVIICDYRMPGFNAQAALRILKQSGLDIPFIVVSGAILEETGIAVMRSGAHDYVMKDNLARLVPVIEREIVEALHRRERQKAEKRALRLGQILDNSSNEIYVFEPDSLAFMQVNRSACENLGYSAEELMNLTLLDLHPDTTPERLAAAMDALLKGERHEIAFETSHTRKDGTTYPVEIRLHLSRTEHPPAFIAIVRDITERKRADATLRIALDKMTDLYRISRSVGTMRTIDDILVSLLDSKYLNVSEALVILFGTQQADTHTIHAYVSKERPAQNSSPPPQYPLAYLVSHKDNVLIEDVEHDDRVAPDVQRQLTEAHIHQVMLFPLRGSGSWYGALALHFANRYGWSADDVRHIEGLVDQVLIAIDNVLLLNSEGEARARAERADQLKLQFLAMISHELRTPLTSIKGFSTTLLAEDVTWEAEDQHKFLTIIDQETDKLTDLIEQLLDLSRLTAGTLRISPRRQTFDHVLETAMMHLKLLTRNHRLVVDVAPDLPPILLDVQRIAQVLENLVGNSVKYSPPESEVRIVAKQNGSSVRVDVIDCGVGIPDDEHEHIFEAFHQIGRSRGAGGAGLGLAICKGLVEAHGGKIWIADTSPAGTTISFTLPSARVS